MNTTVFRFLPVAAVMTVLPAPAHATGGYACRSEGKNPIEIVVGFGHVPGAALVTTRLREGKRTIPASAQQWWLDRKEMRLVLTDPDVLTTLAVLKTRWVGRQYVGTVERDNRTIAVTCRED